MVLAFNTCGSSGSLALGRIDAASGRVEVVAQEILAARASSVELIAKLAGMLEANGGSAREIEAIVVVRGPGSFTGIRVGLSAAKGLAEALGAGVIALSQLEILAAQSGREDVLAAIDAGRGEYYVGEYRPGAAPREGLWTAAELHAAARLIGAQGPAPVALVFEAPATGAEPAHKAAEPAHKEEFASAVYLPPPDAAAALRFAAARFRAGLFDDIAALDANYLRRSDAEVFRARAGARAATAPEAPSPA